MPAILEDPSSLLILAKQVDLSLIKLYEVPGKGYIVPFHPSNGAPPKALVELLSQEMNDEIERGDTYPMESPFTLEAFGAYWFGTFCVVLFKILPPLDPEAEFDWAANVLGTFYIKPNYPGRCSHVCNAGFLVPHAGRGMGNAHVLAAAFEHYAPKLGYRQSIFNLVFETNVASLKIWDSHGFERVGRVPGAGRLKGQDKLVDAIIFSKIFSTEEERS
ncbi:hypothetical protein YB2330_005425 [Saitoella coloradoensis]